MILKNISVVNYKNIRAAQLSLSAKLNCLVGHNGEGKTNFLDAVYYLSFCRSANNPVDSQVMNHGADFFVLEGHYANGDVEEHIYCGMKRGQKKHVKRNKKEYQRLSQHIGLIPVIFVSPSDTMLIEGVSEDRRRLMDQVIAQYDRTYIDSLNAYNKALTQRNALLRQDEEPDPMLLDIWEEEMAREGEKVYACRNQLVDSLVPLFQQMHSQITAGSEQVGLAYSSHCQRGPLLDVIKRDRTRDRAVGYSLHGIHRDDLEFTLDGYPMRREGSQGQNKSFVIALKLAQYALLHNKLNRIPILLLDDIFDKLDARRVERIVSLVATDNFGQIFITDTNRDHLDSILRQGEFDYCLFAVEDGEITLAEERHV